MYPGWFEAMRQTLTESTNASEGRLEVPISWGGQNLLLWDYVDYYPIYIYIYGYGSIPIHTIFRGMNIHLPAILMWTEGVQGFDTLPYIYIYVFTHLPMVGLTSLTLIGDDSRIIMV